jgi:membrane fusion protein, multidrug efflux system
MDSRAELIPLHDGDDVSTTPPSSSRNDATEEEAMAELQKIEALQTAAVVSSDVAAMRSRTRRIVKRSMLALLLLAGATGTGEFGYDYWTHGRFLESTDDAYVQADYTSVAPKISGHIAEVLVEDNQPVTAGQVLARIDDRDFRTALDRAQADVASSQASVHNFDAQLDLQQAEIAEAAAVITATRASLSFAEEDAVRYRDLVRTGAGTVQRAQQTQATRDGLIAQLQRDTAGLTAAQRKIAVLQTARREAAAQMQRAQAAERQAELNLSYTTIMAPVDGTVGARSLRVGQYVTAGTQLMAVVPLHAAYVVANFKETQLVNVRAGQPVRIDVDGLPDARINGHVDSIAPASGLEFALLPPDNATGNFTKIVQRIPVKIVLDDATAAGILRAGMSVESTINTKGADMDSRLAASSPGRAG